MAATATKRQTLPRLRYEIGSTVVPGDRIGTSNRGQILPGSGTYQRSGHIFASVVGKLQINEYNRSDDSSKKGDEGQDTSEQSSQMFVCSVIPRQTHHPSSSGSLVFQDASSQAMNVGQRIVGKVVRLSPQSVMIEIHILEGYGRISTNSNGTDSNNKWEGTIRMEDIKKASNTTGGNGNKSSGDLAQISDCFRIGDWVLARIVSLGTDGGSGRRTPYVLSTAEPELGVIRATSSSAAVAASSVKSSMLIPISWKEMQDPITGIKETRKVARPISSST